MNEAGKNIIQQLFGESDLSNVTRRDIEALTSRYPYFAPAQFLLARKLKDTNGNGSEEQLQKAALYFTNPFWLNYLLQEENLADLANVVVPVTAETDPSLEQQEPIVAGGDSPVVVDEPRDKTTETELADNGTTNPDEHAPLYTTDPITTEAPATEPADLSGEETTSIPAAPAITNEETAAEPQKETTIDEDITGSPEIAIDDTDDEGIVDEETDNAQRIKLSSLIEQHLADFNKPVRAGETLPIEPRSYHTIDYFASQGIKDDAQDKFSSRVRKFTDWLKQMKSVNAQPTDLGTDKTTEQMIEQIAQTSNETRDVVTEAMAEVLAKQGKTDKAMQLYQKLSFLNPDKSTYFAAKIEDLNKK